MATNPTRGSRPDERDLPLMESPTGGGLGRDPRDRRPGSLEDDDDVRREGVEPVEPAPPAPASGYDETADGLSDVEEATRSAAEDRSDDGRGGFSD